MTMRYWEGSVDEEIEQIWPEDIAEILEEMRKTIPNATRKDAVADRAFHRKCLEPRA